MLAKVVGGGVFGESQPLAFPGQTRFSNQAGVFAKSNKDAGQDHATADSVTCSSRQAPNSWAVRLASFAL